MVFSTENLVLIKVLRQWINNHTASLEITVNVHESVLSRKLVFWTSNWKHVIKYYLYVKFPRIFANNVQINAKFCCKNFNDVCQVFRILHHYTFSWTRCSMIPQVEITSSTRLYTLGARSLTVGSSSVRGRITRQRLLARKLYATNWQWTRISHYWLSKARTFWATALKELEELSKLVCTTGRPPVTQPCLLPYLR